MWDTSAQGKIVNHTILLEFSCHVTLILLDKRDVFTSVRAKRREKGIKRKVLRNNPGRAGFQLSPINPKLSANLSLKHVISYVLKSRIESPLFHIIYRTGVGLQTSVGFALLLF